MGRRGIAGDGRGASSRVHYGNGYDNAFWSDACFCMTYGDGDGSDYDPFVSLDIVGHELSHGVTSHTARLRYSGEPGGLNEATSDIFGTLIEFYAQNPEDPPDYLIGERVVRGGGGALRSMAWPEHDHRSVGCWEQGVGSLDVHYSSGIANHFFYLLAEGTGHATHACGTGVSVTGIGRLDAGRIWYRALTRYFTSATSYHGARAATLRAAGDLFGKRSAQYAAVGAAWSAVKVD
jgi:Zn-dependent metalloprotease